MYFTHENVDDATDRQESVSEGQWHSALQAMNSNSSSAATGTQPQQQQQQQRQDQGLDFFDMTHYSPSIGSDDHPHHSDIFSQFGSAYHANPFQQQQQRQRRQESNDTMSPNDPFSDRDEDMLESLLRDHNSQHYTPATPVAEPSLSPLQLSLSSREDDNQQSNTGNEKLTAGGATATSTAANAAAAAGVAGGGVRKRGRPKGSVKKRGDVKAISTKRAFTGRTNSPSGNSPVASSPRGRGRPRGRPRRISTSIPTRITATKNAASNAAAAAAASAASVETPSDIFAALTTDDTTTATPANMMDESDTEIADPDSLSTDAAPPDTIKCFIKPARKSSTYFIPYFPERLYCAPYKYDVRIHLPEDRVRDQLDNDFRFVFRLLDKETRDSIPLNTKGEPSFTMEKVTERSRMDTVLDSDVGQDTDHICLYRVCFNLCSFHNKKKPFVFSVELQPLGQQQQQQQQQEEGSVRQKNEKTLKHESGQFWIFARKSNRESETWGNTTFKTAMFFKKKKKKKVTSDSTSATTPPSTVGTPVDEGDSQMSFAGTPSSPGVRRGRKRKTMPVVNVPSSQTPLMHTIPSQDTSNSEESGVATPALSPSRIGEGFARYWQTKHLPQMEGILPSIDSLSTGLDILSQQRSVSDTIKRPRMSISMQGESGSTLPPLESYSQTGEPMQLPSFESLSSEQFGTTPRPFTGMWPFSDSVSAGGSAQPQGILSESDFSGHDNSNLFKNLSSMNPMSSVDNPSTYNPLGREGKPLSGGGGGGSGDDSMRSIIMGSLYGMRGGGIGGLEPFHLTPFGGDQELASYRLPPTEQQEQQQQQQQKQQEQRQQQQQQQGLPPSPHGEQPPQQYDGRGRTNIPGMSELDRLFG